MALFRCKLRYLRPRLLGHTRVVVDLDHASNGENSELRFGISCLREGEIMRQFKNRSGQASRFRMRNDLTDVGVKSSREVTFLAKKHLGLAVDRFSLQPLVVPR